MAPSLEDVLSALTPERRARVEARAQELMEEELTGVSHLLQLTY